MAVINASESAHDLDLSFKGISLGKGRMWRMTGDSLNAVTGLGKSEVRIRETSLAEIPKSVTIAPISIEIYAFERR